MLALIFCLAAFSSCKKSLEELGDALDTDASDDTMSLEDVTVADVYYGKKTSVSLFSVDGVNRLAFYYEGNTRIAKPGTVCSESWLVAGAFDTELEAKSYKSYIFTKIVRFLLLQTVVSQNISKKNYCFIPDLEKYSGEYTDEKLHKMWGITQDEWAYIDSRIGEIGK
jgi:hypothetical protein